MKIPFVGASYTAQSLNANAQRSVNCYLEYQRQDDGTTRAVALYGRPGMTLRATAADSRARGSIVCGSYCYKVIGSTVYRMDTSYTLVSLGTIGTTSGQVGMAEDGDEVLIVDGVTGWIATSTTLTEIADADFPDGVTRAAYVDGYFLVAGDGSGKFYWNETPGTGTGWNGLDFATAEGATDNTEGLIVDHREAWLFGSRTAEIWLTDSAATFARSGNAFLEQGCAAAASICAMNNSVYWLGKGKDGQGVVFRAEGYTPVRISDHGVEQAISGYSTISDAFAFAFQIKGHSFYVLTFPTADATWVHDAATDRWFEWGWRDPDENTEHRLRAGDYVFFNGKHIVGDWESGKIYTLEPDVYTDNSDPILFLRRTQCMNEDGARLFFEELTIDMETGVANADATDPQVMYRYSNDGGHTWSNEKRKSIGAVGQYGKRVKFGPTGAGRNRVHEISITDAVKRAVFGAFARVSKGD